MTNGGKRLLWALVAAVVVGLFAPLMVVSAAPHDDSSDSGVYEERSSYCWTEDNPNR